MSDSGGTQQPWSPGGQPPPNPGWGQQPAPGTPPQGYGPPPGPPQGTAYGAPGGPPPAWNQPAQAPKGGIQAELTKFPWLLASAALAIAFVAVAIGDIVNTFQKQSSVRNGSGLLPLLSLKPNGLTGRDRVLQFFDFGQPAWALLLLVAIALLAFGPRITGQGESAASRRLLIDVLLVSAAAVVLAGLVDAVIYLTLLGDAFTLALHGFLESLGGSVIGLAAAYWAFGLRTKAPKAPKAPKAASAPPPPPWGPAGGAPPAPPTTGFQPGQYQPPGGAYAPPQQGGYPPPGS